MFNSWADYAQGGLYVSDTTASIVVQNTLGVDVTVTATVVNLSFRGDDPSNYARVIVDEDTSINVIYSDTIYAASPGGGISLDSDNKITNAKIIARGE